MRLYFKPLLIMMLIASTFLLSECSPPSPAPAAIPSFQHESYREELMYREQMIEQGRALHIKKERLVV